jgi:peptidoglycan/xylan/chitin deacetylase (PgdA/CDA1 family)
MYHSVGGTSSRQFNLTLETFKGQIKFISTNFKIIRLSEIQEKLSDKSTTKNHPRYCVITFDDAYQNIVKNVHKIMVQYQVPYTIFVPTDFIGAKTDWMNASEQILNRKEIKQLHKSGLVDFGSHTASHQNMEMIDPQKQIREAKKSKQELESLLGIQSINMFSYPYGGLHDYSKKTTARLQEAGYKIAVTTRFSAMNSIDNLMTLRRVQLLESDTSKTIFAKLNGEYDWFRFKERLAYFTRKIFSITVR